MAVYPVSEMSFEELVAVRNGVNPLGSPPGEPVGIIPGLNSSLIALLRNFDPGNLGVCVVEDKLQLGLTVRDWDIWDCGFKGNIAVPAGSTDTITVLTVPRDERWWVYRCLLSVTGGDNLGYAVRKTYPAGYFEGSEGEQALILLTTPASNIFWPDPGIEQASLAGRAVLVPEMIWEPGSILGLECDGTGVAETFWNYEVMATRTKIIRAMAP